MGTFIYHTHTGKRSATLTDEFSPAITKEEDNVADIPPLQTKLQFRSNGRNMDHAYVDKHNDALQMKLKMYYSFLTLREA